MVDGKRPTREELVRALRAAGVRLTPQREAVWNWFVERPSGAGVAEAARALATRGVGLATVYRTVALLEELGLLRRFHDACGEHRYVAARPGHGHALVCRVCGRAVPFEACALDLLERLLAVETGFVVEGHSLEVYGVCPGCQEEK
ncbi:ferric uptake regulator, Fur family [Marinithermus hydrothermalis DSM 14884]|uniref:Ferric uptake regulator, Fur family n=1 Tax=Marinithermus hydrothermalis (strain DSM 14884 / JCM 11576 / T1) TaxID=869210 RepID=F2NMG0_MARHT|nr:ferric uptake regulator, Fur family [Marinithermus hydrothermalis DSM 14884]